MIDEKKLIEEIERQVDLQEEKRKEYEKIGSLFIKYMHGKLCFETALDMIEQQPKAGEWIPCSERMPSESGDYLVWYDCGDEEEGCMVVNFDAGIGAFGDWYDQYDSYTLGFLDSEFIYCNTAVAWMPLPEPYKKEEP